MIHVECSQNRWRLKHTAHNSRLVSRVPPALHTVKLSGQPESLLPEYTLDSHSAVLTTIYFSYIADTKHNDFHRAAMVHRR